SYYWNNKMVFTKEEGAERVWWKALIKTYISYSFTGLFLNSVLLILWVQVLGISEFIAPIINLLVSVPINFIINKFWAFKTEKVAE
ncbi:MAG: GtrA family protein, partial [Butyrivibrio sp.]|nr:GtrA family protein [Butyrivibrio sp.]